MRVHAGPHAEAVQAVHEVLGCYVAGCALGVGAAAEPADGAVEGADPVLEPDERVDQRLAVRVVEVQRQVLVDDPRGRQRLEQLPRPRRRAHARRVRDRHLVRAHLQQRGRHLGDAVRVDVRPFVRTAERDGDVAPDADVLGFGEGEDRLEALH